MLFTFMLFTETYHLARSLPETANTWKSHQKTEDIRMLSYSSLSKVTQLFVRLEADTEKRFSRFLSQHSFNKWRVTKRLNPGVTDRYHPPRLSHAKTRVSLPLWSPPLVVFWDRCRFVWWGWWEVLGGGRRRRRRLWSVWQLSKLHITSVWS